MGGVSASEQGGQGDLDIGLTRRSFHVTSLS